MEEQLQTEALRQARNALRLAMNGVISASLRTKGMNYKLIFGVPFPELRRIASAFEPDVSLAEAMWQEDVRELKILATMLYPPAACTEAVALRWTGEVPYPEIAEQLVRNLLAKRADADGLALRLLEEPELPFARMVAFLLFLYGSDTRRPEEDPAGITRLRSAAVRQLLEEEPTDWYGRQAALQALKHYGRRSRDLSDAILVELAPLEGAQQPERRALYDDIRFEYEYYRE